MSRLISANISAIALHYHVLFLGFVDLVGKELLINKTLKCEHVNENVLFQSDKTMETYCVN